MEWIGFTIRYTSISFSVGIFSPPVVATIVMGGSFRWMFHTIPGNRRPWYATSEIASSDVEHFSTWTFLARRRDGPRGRPEVGSPRPRRLTRTSSNFKSISAFKRICARFPKRGHGVMAILSGMLQELFEVEIYVERWSMDLWWNNITDRWVW